MTANEMKNSFLQEALKGNLVSQKIDDEPVCELLSRINDKKTSLNIKDKSKSTIFRGNDGLFYEKIDDEVICIENITPFDIPKSWTWCRLKNIAHFSLGRTPPRKESRFWKNPEHFWVTISDFTDNICKTKESISNIAYNEFFKGKITPAGTLLMSFKLSVGKVAILDVDAFHNEAIVSIKPFDTTENIMRDYLFMTLPLLSKNADYKLAIMGKSLNSNSIKQLLIPIPPLSEQKRIVLTLKKLYTLFEKYDVCNQKLLKINNEFPENFKQSILNYAILGKLTSQISDNSSKLLDEINIEKSELILNGTIKKDRFNSRIIRRDNSHYEKMGENEKCIDNEIPFEIPENWCWCRLSELGKIVSGGTPKTNILENWENGDIPWITPTDIRNIKGKYVSYGERFITKEGLNSSTAKILPKGSIVFSCRAPIGYIAITQNELCTNQGFRSIIPIKEETQMYIYYCLKAITPQIVNNAKGSIFKEISTEEFANILIPLPPLEEQKKIVKKLEILAKIPLKYNT